MIRVRTCPIWLISDNLISMINIINMIYIYIYMCNMYKKFIMFYWLYIFLHTEVRDGICKWVVCDLFCVHVDVTPFIFIYTHLYINMVIASTALGLWNKSSGVFHKIVTIEHAIYGLRFQIKFKTVKVAHIPISI